MMKRLFIFIALAGSAFGQASNISWEANATTVTVTYTVPSSMTTTDPCSVDASDDSTFATHFNDVNASLFTGADTDLGRDPYTVRKNGRRQVAIGTLGTWTALNGKIVSRTLPAAGPAFIKLTCNGVATTIAAQTKPIGYGNSFAEALPVHPTRLGEYALPSIDWDNDNKVIDWETGATHIIKKPSASAQTPSAEIPFATVLSASGWTTPTAIKADDSSSATISGSQSPIVLPWNYSAQLIGDLETTNADSGGWDYLKLTLKGFCTASAQDDRTVQACLSLNGGVSCFTPWNDIVLPTSMGTVSFPASPKSGDFWQTPGDKPIPRHLLAKRAGRATYNSTTHLLSFTNWQDINGNNFYTDRVSPEWVVGTPISFLDAAQVVCGMTAGTPVTVTMCSPHGYTTGQSVSIQNIPGSIGTDTMATWVITVTSTTTFTLNGSSSSGSYGQTTSISPSSGTAGSPANLYMPNTNWVGAESLGIYASVTGCSGGWTSLNNKVWHLLRQGGFDTEHWDFEGSTTTGAYPGDCSVKINGLIVSTNVGPTVYVAKAQKTVDMTISGFKDAFSVYVNSGPASDVTVANDWVVNPLAVMIRKKTTSADVANLQFASMSFRKSGGASLGAFGKGVCAEGTVTGPGGKKGNICGLPQPNFVSEDGTTVNFMGWISAITTDGFFEATANGQGRKCSTGVYDDQGAFGVNPNKPNRIYCAPWTFTHGSDGGQGGDRNILVIDYEGDFSARSPSEGNDSLYPGYSGNPWTPNCYGAGKYNDGVNPKVITDGSPCASYKLVVPSVQTMVQNYGNQLWRRLTVDIKNMWLESAFVWDPISQTVKFSTMSKWNNGQEDEIGIFWVIDLGDEKHYTDPSITHPAAPVAEVATWDREDTGWCAIHGGGAYRNPPYLDHLCTIIGWGQNGAGKTYLDIADPSAFTSEGAGPYWFDYTSVDGVSNADITASMHACPNIGSRYYPNGVPPNGVNTVQYDRSNNPHVTGCITVTISGEPCDISPGTLEGHVLAANPSFHAAKCGKSNAMWIGDVKVGDNVGIFNPTRSDPRGWEVTKVIQKTGSGPGATLELMRGGYEGYISYNVYGDIMGAENHTGHPHHMWMAPGGPVNGQEGNSIYDIYANPTGGCCGDHLAALSHGASGNAVEVGGYNADYGVFLGDFVTRIHKTVPEYTVAKSPAWNRVAACDPSSCDSHTTLVQGAINNMKYGYFLDGRPWQGTGGRHWLLVGGTNNIYKLVNASNVPIDMSAYDKFTPLIARNGIYAIKDISGPGSLLTDSGWLQGCHVHKANECFPGSTKGEYYVSSPFKEGLVSTYTCCGNKGDGQKQDLDVDPAIITRQRLTQSLIKPDMTGRATRMVTNGWEQYRTQNTFMNWSVTNNGKLFLSVSSNAEFQKSITVLSNVVPSVEDSWDRTKWYQHAMTIPPYPGADNFFVRFGYAHYSGSTGTHNLRCFSQYADNCVMAASTTTTDPYWFETADTWSGISISNSPVVVKIPAIPGRPLITEVVYRSGTTVLNTTPQEITPIP